MNFDESTAIIGIAVAVGGVLLFGSVAFVSFRSNTEDRSWWKVVVGGIASFLAVSFLATGISPGIQYVEARTAASGSALADEATDASVVGGDVDAQGVEVSDAQRVECGHGLGLALVARNLSDSGLVQLDPKVMERVLEVEAAQGQRTGHELVKWFSDEIWREITSKVSSERFDRACVDAWAVLTTTTIPLSMEERAIAEAAQWDLTDAEAVWCESTEGRAAQFLAGDSLGLLATWDSDHSKLSIEARRALENVVATGDTGLSGSAFDSLQEELQAFLWLSEYGLDADRKRACKAAYESR